jgi:hypothetical protein
MKRDGDARTRIPGPERASPAPKGERGLGLAALAVLLGALALSLGWRLPAPLPLDAPAESFSGARAGRILARIARAPHPVGSEEHERVRATLLEELRALGLEPEPQEGAFLGVELANLLVRMPGSAPTGTVLCLAHYDSVPTGPGAGDDGVGVVAWLEVLRALRARGLRPRNDVVLLLSDGEELGLYGAHFFAVEHPLARSVRVVVNLEAIGNGGPAVLFELGPRNGPRVREFARAVRAPVGTSLCDAVYGRMPNDTDLSVFLRRGVPGFNLALTAGSSAYHAPHDTPENLDPRSLQHMGECALALVERMGALDLGALQGPDLTFFDLLGLRIVRYPRGWDALLVLAGLTLSVLAWRRLRPRGGELLRAVTAHALEGALLGGMLALAWWLLDRSAALFTPDPGWVPGNTTSGALLLAGLVLLVAARAALRGGEPRARSDLRGLAALAVWSGLAPAALLLLPGASFAFHVPLILAAAGQLAANGRRSALVALPLGFAAALLVCLPILHLLLQLFQRAPLQAVLACGGVLASAAGLFTPQLRAIARAARWNGAALLVLGLAALAASVLVARVLGWRQGALWP